MQGAKLSFMAHVLMDHRSGLPVATAPTLADGYAERAAALGLTRAALRAEGVTPHIAQHITKIRSAIDVSSRRRRATP